MNAAYLEDASGFRGSADALHLPSGESELQAILGEASARGISVTVSGAGTGVTGGRVAQGGWVVSLERFTTVAIEEGTALVGAGVSLRDLQVSASRMGQFYAPDPTEMLASLGGTIATNASGSRSFRYGDTRRHVLELRIALMDGSIREFHRGQQIDFETPALPRPQTTKHTAGFPLYPGMDWIDLFIGSEGILGVITCARVRLLPAVTDLLTGVIFFRHDLEAMRAVRDWRPVQGLRMLEYFDEGSLTLLRTRYSEVPADARAALLIEQEGDDTAGEWESRLEQSGAMVDESWFALNAADRERFRRLRHALPELVNDTVRRRGLLKMGTDFAVPIARNDEMVGYYHSRLNHEFPGQYVIFGHIGDAHVHANILPRDGDEANRARDLMTEFAAQAVSLGGTVSAEHGLGKRKAHLLALQYTAEQIQAMEAVKRRLDPKWLLGRGNLLPVPPA